MGVAAKALGGGGGGKDDLAQGGGTDPAAIGGALAARGACSRDPPLRPGVRLGVDVGTVRIGVARCDPAGILATPLDTVRRGKGDYDRIIGLAEENEAVEIVVGSAHVPVGS